jgi:archaemetzincin
MPRKVIEASSNGRTADFGSAYEGSNPSASARPPVRAPNQRAEVKPLPMPERFLVVPIGPVPKGLLAELTAALQEVFGAPSDLGTALVKPDFAFNKDRLQYHSTAVLRRLDTVRPRGREEPVLGVVDVDLFVPDMPFVFGEADREARTALVSVFRLKGADGRPVDPDRLRRRLQVEAIHEIGHLLGLSHCSDFRCAMFLSHTAADADRKNPALCPLCKAALGLS